ncbi:MAG TPA: hypothetical protein VEC37_01580, partial [Bacillota bacterium]|nr:hypothetical protein [Bacillota bacterium]
MLNTVHYTLRTTSVTGQMVNAIVTYDVYFDQGRGIAYDVELQARMDEMTDLQRAWRAKIVNQNEGRRQEYDCLQRIYYQTMQTIKVESALINLQEDLQKFLQTSAVPVSDTMVGTIGYPGRRLHTLTIWYDPQRNLPIRRENRDRGNLIIDEFLYHTVNEPIAEDRFELPKPAEAIANFDLYPEPPYLPRFEFIPDANSPQYGVYVDTLVEEIRRFVVQNQWEYGPFATIKLPWLTRMPLTIYRAKIDGMVPPLIVAVDVPQQGRAYFTVSYDFLGYVTTGFSQDPPELSAYNQLPIIAELYLEELAPLYQAPSFEKEFVIHNFVNSVQSNDFFINVFEMGGKVFDLVIKNFSFHENEGYVLLNVYGKEYWDNANIEAMFNFIVTG